MLLNFPSHGMPKSGAKVAKFFETTKQIAYIKLFRANKIAIKTQLQTSWLVFKWIGQFLQTK